MQTNKKKRKRLTDPAGNLARGFRVTVEVVGVQGDGGDHDAEDVQAPEEGGDHVVVGVFEGEAQADQAGEHERGREPDGAQAGLGLEVAGVRADVLVGDHVVDPVARDLAQQGGDDGREVEEADLLGAEVVERG